MLKVMLIQENVALAPFTTLRVGGPARYFVEARTTEDMREAIAYAQKKQLPLFTLGGGSNLVVADSGWAGLVLKIGIMGINHRHSHHEPVFDAGAGEDWDSFVAITVAHNCSGIECLSGIPGTVGGTPVQNVGAYGQEVADTIQSVRVFDLQTMEEDELSNKECGFAYRTSIFNTIARGRYIVLQVSYALPHGGEAHIAYADLKKYFAGRTTPPTLAETREAVRSIRSSKAMLITEGDNDSRSAGSFFKNPVLTPEGYSRLTKLASERKLDIPSYPAQNSQRKISAAWLVEHSGFSKGFTSGHVGLSSKHALALVNRGGATAEEIISLKNQIQRAVQETWGVSIEPEPVFVGF
jgi:UDP-N-acetylmuramate dehydrogenase